MCYGVRTNKYIYLFTLVRVSPISAAFDRYLIVKATDVTDATGTVGVKVVKIAACPAN